jgi:hypothetical protein
MEAMITTAETAGMFQLGKFENGSCVSGSSAANIVPGKDMRRKFELLMQDLWQALEHPSKDRSVLGVAVYGVRPFIPELVRGSHMVRQVLAFVEALRCSEMPGRQVQEEELMLILNSLAWNTTGWLRDYGCQQVPAFDQIGAAPVEFQARLQVLRDLHDFALACFAFKRPRDSFGGKRRGLAYEILGHVGGMADLPEVVTMARKSLKQANSVESRQAADFLKQYFTERDIPQDDTIIDELLSLAERTDSRSTVFSALDALVENGAICEFEAMSRMDDWKSKHRL